MGGENDSTQLKRRTDFLTEKAQALCESFAAGESPDKLLSYFSNDSPVAHEHGPYSSQIPFLGRDYVDKANIKKYFELLSGFLGAESMQFVEYITDPISSKVAVRGKARFVYKSTGIGWDEVFVYILSMDASGLVARYEVWADALSMGLAARGERPS